MESRKSKNQRRPRAFVRVTPGQEPTVYETDQIDRRAINDRIEEFLGDSPEVVTYPTQLKGTGSFGLLVVDRGIHKPTAYNRWGIVGPFAIAKFNVHGRIIPLTPKDVETIFEELRTSKGYLDPSCGIGSPFRGPFAEHGEPPSGAVPTAGRWFATTCRPQPCQGGPQY